MRQVFFVDPAPLRSDLLQMEVRLAHVLIDDIKHAVLHEDAIRQYVEDLKAAQDSISSERPKLRRVEISHDLDNKGWGWHSDGQARYIRVGQYCCPLIPVTKIEV